MTKLSLTQSAAHVGKSKAALSKAIKTGRLTAIKVGNAYQIDISELTRVYPVKRGSVPESIPLATVLENQNKLLQEALDREREISDDYRARLDAADTRVTALLTNQTPRKRFFGIF